MGTRSTWGFAVALGAVGLWVSACRVDDTALTVTSVEVPDPSPSGPTRRDPSAAPSADTGAPMPGLDAGAMGVGIDPSVPDPVPSDAQASLEADQGSGGMDAAPPPTADSAPQPEPPPPDRGTVVIQDNFADRTNFNDLSTLIAWGGRPAGTSAFTLLSYMGRRAVALDPQALKFADIENRESLRTFGALDYKFPTAIAHRSTRLRISFDATWDKISTSGEGGRLTFMLMHDYPAQGPRPSDDKRRNGSPFGRPAYSLRLLNGPKGHAVGEPFLQYGGGEDIRGTFDFLDGSWLPGFLKAPGGGTPGGSSPWPKGGWVEAARAVATTTWRRFSLVVEPKRFWLESADGGIEMEMPLPESASAPLYNYFETFEALRIAWRGVEQAYLANLTVTVEDLP